MAEFKEIVAQFNRMCDAMPDCDKCPLDKTRGILTCWRMAFDKPEKFEEVVTQWNKEHPAFTNRQKFKEVFGFDPYSMAIFSVNAGEWLHKEWLHKEYKEPKDDK